MFPSLSTRRKSDESDLEAGDDVHEDHTLKSHCQLSLSALFEIIDVL